MDGTPQRTMNLPPSGPSVLAPVSRAIGWTRVVLFRPFEIRKWFVLGFCAWLAWLGRNGGPGFNWNLSGGNRGRDWERVGRESGQEAWVWVLAHAGMVLVLIAFAFVFLVVLWLVLTWISSRGKFMFLDGVLNDRGAVVEPWKVFREPGNSLWLFRIVLSIAALAGIGLVVCLMVLNLVLGGAASRGPGLWLVGVIALWLAILFPLIFFFALIEVATNDFVVPIMWLRGCRVMAAWRELRGLLAARPGTFVLYVLVKIVMAIVIFSIACVATCLTCCIVALPYLGTVILLPIFVFRRSYSLHFLAQFSPDYAPLAPAPPGSRFPGAS